MYKWITFKELRGLSRTEFARELGKSCLAIWIDDSAGFGTFPLEAMECNTPVIGKMPNMIPEWMEATDDNGVKHIRNNGIWTNTTLNIPELISTYLRIWLEDNIPEDLSNEMEKTKGSYTPERQKEAISVTYKHLVENRKEELNNLLTMLEEAEVETTK